MPKKEQIILPDKYYLDYFLYLLGFIQRHYDHVLDVPETLFFKDFHGLSESAQCLFVRLINRRGPFFRFNKINYEEIQDLTMACEELYHGQFLVMNESDDISQLHLFTKAELVGFFPFLDKSDKKSEMLEMLNASDIDTIHQHESILEVKKRETVEFLKLLFFGNHYQQMTEFVIRDIGNIKLRQLDEAKFSPWFHSRADALGVMHVSQLRAMIKELIRASEPIEEFLQEIPWDTWMQYTRTKPQAEKLLLELGAYFEKSNQLEEALHYYAYCTKHPAGERRIRILEKVGRTADAVKLAQQILEQPSNATARTFASDFLNRSGARIDRSMTKRLKEAKAIELERPEKSVEAAVIDYFEAQGWEGIHGENFLWRSLFGLTFWKEVFDEDMGSFHHPLQRQPSDIHDLDFYANRESTLRSRLSNLRTKKAYLKYLTSNYRENEGIANRFVYWHEDLLSLVEKMIHFLPLRGIQRVMLEIAKQAKENSTGFPDLFLWRGDEYQFYEVKSPNDHLSAQQLFWIKFLDQSKIRVEILKVNYIA